MLQYLRLIIAYYIHFGPASKLVIYSNANYIIDKNNYKSITISVGLINRGLVFWGSCKQTTVITATTEAEYIAISFIVKQG